MAMSTREAITNILTSRNAGVRSRLPRQIDVPSITKTHVDEADYFKVISSSILSSRPLLISLQLSWLCTCTMRVACPVFGSNPIIHCDDFEAKQLRDGQLRFEALRPAPRRRHVLPVFLASATGINNYDHQSHALSIEFKPRQSTAEPLMLRSRTDRLIGPVIGNMAL